MGPGHTYQSQITPLLCQHCSWHSTGETPVNWVPHALSTATTALQLGNFFFLSAIYPSYQTHRSVHKMWCFSTTEIDLKEQFLRSPSWLWVCKDSSLGERSGTNYRGTQIFNNSTCHLNVAFPATKRSLCLLGISTCCWAAEYDFPHHHKLKKSQEAYKVKDTFDTQKMND